MLLLLPQNWGRGADRQDLIYQIGLLYPLVDWVDLIA